MTVTKNQKLTVINNGFLNFIISQEKHMDIFFKKLVDSRTMSEETQRYLKPMGIRPGIMYASFRVFEKCGNGYLSFRPTLCALKTLIYKFAAYVKAINYQQIHSERLV